MNRFSRVRHHVSVEDVKKKHLEKIAVENFIKTEEEISKTISEKFKRNWRRELEEGMTTANTLSTVLPAEGDTAIDQVSPIDAASFADVNNMFGSGADNPALDGATIRANGSGSGDNGGFNVGGEYLAFQGDGSGGSRMALLSPMDATKVDTLTITAIRGNDSNGGEDPDVVGQEELFVIYKTPEMSRSSYLSQDRSQNNIGSFPADAAIIAIGQGDGTLQDYTITIPEYARQKDTVFGLFQLSHSGTGYDHYGVTDIKFQRKTPLNVVVSLDSPEAISFVRVGTDEGDPKKRKKKVNDQLKASDEYTTKQMGGEFPGQGARLGDEASSAGAPDPFSSASIQEPEASPIGKDAITKAFAKFSAQAASAEPEVEPEVPITPSAQATMQPKTEDGEEIPVTTIDPKTGTVEGSDAADIEQTDEDPPSEEEIEREKEIETQAEIEEPPTAPEEEENLSDEEKEETKLTKLYNDFKNKAFDILRGIDKFDAPVDLALNSIVAFLGLSKNTIRIGRMFQRTSNILFGTNFGTDEKAYLEGITAMDKWLNDVKIAQSYLTGKIVKHNYGYEQIKSYADNLTPEYFMLLQGGKHYSGSDGAMGISDTRHEYVDDNIYVKNGEVFVNDQNISPLANMDTRNKGKGKTSLVEEIGKGYGQMVIPKDGSKPYFHFYDYNYLNLNSKDADLVTGSLVGADKEVPSNYQMTFANIAGSLRKILPGRLFDDMVNKLEGNLKTFDSNLRERVGLDGWPPGIHGATLTDFKIPLESLPEETQKMIANHPLSWTPERVANMSAEDFGEQFRSRAFEKFEFDLAGKGEKFEAYVLKALEDPDSGVDPEFLKNYKRYGYTEYDEKTRKHIGAEKGTVEYDYDRAVEELEKISNTPEYSAASKAAFKEYEDVLAEEKEKSKENNETNGTAAQLKLWEKLVGPYYRAVVKATTTKGGSMSSNHPTYQNMVNGKKEFDKQVKVMERKYAQVRDANMDKYGKLWREAYARYKDTNTVVKLDDGTMGLVNGGDFKTKNGKIIKGMDTLSAKEKARFDEVRAEYDEIQKYLSSANWDDNYVKPYVLYDVKTDWSKYGKLIPSESWTPEKFGSGKRPQDDPDFNRFSNQSFGGSTGATTSASSTDAATLASNRRKKRRNESIEYFGNPHGKVSLYEKLKTKGFFNPKDIKPTFPENDPPEIDKKTGMHPDYGKQAKRYKKLDPMSANAMPVQGDPELDAVVDQQRTKKKPAERKKEYIKTVSKIKKMAKRG